MSLGTLALVIAFIWILYKKTQQDKVMRLKKLVVLPLLFYYFLYETLQKHYPALSSSAYAGIVTGIVLGIAFGFIVKMPVNIKADKEQALVLIPASWLSAIVLLIVVGLKFGIGYLIATYPGIASGGMQFIIVGVLAFASSIIAGSNLCYLMKYNATSSEHLDPPPKKKRKHR